MTSPPFRSGYVAIIGWPNVGKSTLLNSLLGQKVSIVSPKPQTTREAIQGILNEPGSQLIFVDTPGWMKPSDSYQHLFRTTILRAIREDCDVLLWVREPVPPSLEERQFFDQVIKVNKPLVIAVNKIDTVNGPAGDLKVLADFQGSESASVDVFTVSAKTKQGLTPLKQGLMSKLPIHPPYYPTDQLSDRWERFFVADMVREQILSLFRDEVPHASYVKVEEFKEHPGQKDHIRVFIYVETEGQKRIIVGQGGRSIKDLGQRSRKEIENWLGRPVYLELTVKIHKNWRNDSGFLSSVRSNHYF